MENEMDLVAQYALVGAEIRLLELDAERKRIFQMFPSLNGGSVLLSAVTPVPVPEPVAELPPTRKTRKPLTPAQRKAISRRMRVYWRQKRQAK